MRASSFPLASLLAAVLASTACSPAAKPETPAATEEQKAEPAAAPAASGPVARVNGVELPRDVYTRQMERTRARFERAGREVAPALELRLKENLIRKMVDDELIAQKAKAEGVTLAPEELAEKIKEHKARFGSDQAFAAFLERTGQNEADVTSDIERNALREKLFEKLLGGAEPSLEDAKTYYAENQAKYKQREQIRASHILFKVNESDPPEVKTAQKAKAQDVLKKAKAKGANFAELAKQYSEGPTAPRGGDLGAFSRGRMVKPFEDAAFAAKVGEVIGPVETQFGYHVIHVVEKTPERQRAFDEVKDSIVTSLKARAKSQATRDLLRSLKQDAKVEVLEEGVNLEAKAAERLMPNALGDKPVINETQIERMRELAKQAAERGAAPASGGSIAPASAAPAAPTAPATPAP